MIGEFCLNAARGLNYVETLLDCCAGLKTLLPGEVLKDFLLLALGFNLS